MVTSVNKDLYINKRDSNYRGCEEMHAQKALQAILLTFILTVGSVIPALLSPSVSAQPTQGNTTLYFTNALNFSAIENFSDFGFAPISLNPPTNQNDSQYPPILFVKNTTKLLPRYTLNSDQWITWFTSAWLIYFLEGTPGFNLSDLFNYFGNGTFNGYDITLLLPNPFRVVESYTYNGNSEITINGDLSFNLYFTPPENERPKFRDELKVGLYSLNQNSLLPLPKLITNTNITLAPKGSNIYNQPITLQNVSHTLIPGESLLFSVEIIPSNKTLPTVITKLFNVSKFLERWEKRANRLENRTRLPTLQTIGTTIKDILSVLEESGVNITSKDIAAILNTFISSRFVYDSSIHASSVTVPAKISEEDIRIYYLHAGQGMNEIPSEGTNKTSTKINTTPTIWTTDQVLDRNKILKVGNVTAELYFYRALSIFPGKVTVTVSLYDDNTTIASVEKVLTRKETQAFYQKPTDPIIFRFTGSDVEISNGHYLGVGISLSSGTKKVRTPLYVRYDSAAYPAFLRIKYEETQNIKIRDANVTPADKKIIPHGTVEYTLNVTSLKADNLTISTIEGEKIGAWSITVPEPMTVAANSVTRIPVFINSTDPLKAAYGNTVNLVIVISGKTGIARESAFAEVSKDAIRYSVEILDYSKSITIPKGENDDFNFIIKNNNTGADNDIDNYTVSATSKNHWPIIARDLIRNVPRGGTSVAEDARVNIEVPKNTSLDSDVVTVTITSVTDPGTTASITITVNVQPPGILESIYKSFNSLAKSLGLSEIFGDNAGVALAGILTIIILFIIIILAFVLTLKDVRILCTDRIKEIEPDQQALFELTLKNPTKKPQSYEVTTQQTGQPAQWAITTEPTRLQVEGRQSKPVQIIATPAETIMPKDWTEITVRVHKTSKKKTEHIDLMAMIKEGKTLLQIGNVAHWPIEFNPGDRIVTSFSISNKGTISARGITIFLYINGKQKNKINATIPAGGVADVQMPWIAVKKGKNKVRIRLKEQ